MPRSGLGTARRRLLRLLRRFHDRLAGRAIVREPLTGAQQEYAARRVRELGLAEKGVRD